MPDDSRESRQRHVRAAFMAEITGKVREKTLFMRAALHETARALSLQMANSEGNLLSVKDDNLLRTKTGQRFMIHHAEQYYDWPNFCA